MSIPVVHCGPWCVFGQKIDFLVWFDEGVNRMDLEEMIPENEPVVDHGAGLMFLRQKCFRLGNLEEEDVERNTIWFVDRIGHLSCFGADYVIGWVPGWACGHNAGVQKLAVAVAVVIAKVVEIDRANFLDAHCVVLDHWVGNFVAETDVANLEVVGMLIVQVGGNL